MEGPELPGIQWLVRGSTIQNGAELETGGIFQPKPLWKGLIWNQDHLSQIFQ